MDWMDSFGTIFILALAVAASALLRKGGGTTSC